MKLALAGDTMLGRKVAEHLAEVPPTALFADGVVAAAHEADLFILNLECAISDRGEPWPDPNKPFFFRAPPIAVEALRHLGVGCVTLANNHALDFGTVALLDTCRHLANAGIEWVGAGVDERAARTPVVLDRGGLRIGIVGVTDHPFDYAAKVDRPGVAYADLRHRTPDWLLDDRPPRRCGRRRRVAALGTEHGRRAGRARSFGGGGAARTRAPRSSRATRRTCSTVSSTAWSTTLATSSTTTPETRTFATSSGCSGW